MERTILWVDDEIDQLKAYIIFLEERGFKVETASNGADAIEAVKAKAPDLLLLDEMMPGKDGLSTLVEIKEINPTLPVIMVTKSEEERLMDQAIGRKIDDYLTKPVNPSQILSAVKKILDKRRLLEEHLTQQFIAEFNRMNILLSGPLTWQDWVNIHVRQSEMGIELESFRDVGLKQSHLDQRRQFNAEFAPFYEKNYLSWIKGDGPILSVDVVKRFVAPHIRPGNQVIFIVIDCMRLDQWLMIEPLIAEYFNIKRDYYYSIIPTATPFSRNAIFAGEFPDKVADLCPELWGPASNEYSRNRNERQLMDRQLKKLGIKLENEAKYIKILDFEEGQNLAKKIKTYSTTPLMSLVYNFVDILAHGRSESEILQEIAPDEAAFRSLMKSWFEHSHLFEMLRKLAKSNCTIIITTDHGSVLGTRGAIVYGKRDTSTNLRYKYGDNLNCDPKQTFLIKNPKEYRLPTWGLATTYVIAREDYYFVYPTNLSEYRRQYRNSFQHGGISLDEVILPVVTLQSK
ncbi:MAG: bifunctional response regulator/alkaline phosphatase family protein [candidate division Zixibacteria bacterium]|jgi:CheY-like chemotaxis protein|nr:bifunctional response regulator/alkaline phosphatase family protein [candidate division Zixibacteria bacterium]